MPQFDFTKFSSQIFWLAICFAVLYYFVSKIILPRIQQIIAARSNLINQNISEGKKLEAQINALQEKADHMRQEASKVYQSEIEKSLKSAQNSRESTLEHLKNHLDHMNSASSDKIKEFMAHHLAQSSATVATLTKSIKEKLLS